MAFLKAVALAFVVFGVLLVVLSTAWWIILVGAMEGVWRKLDEGPAQALGVTLLAFAVLSGLAAYAFSLQLILKAVLAVPSGSAWRYALAAGGLPIAVTVAGLWLIVSNLRFGW